MEVVDGKNIDKFFYRVCWYHKKIRKVFYGSWNKFNLGEENKKWIMKQNKKYPECYYWMEGYLLNDRENYLDLDNEDKIYKNIEYFNINQDVVEILDSSENVVDRFFYLNSE